MNEHRPRHYRSFRKGIGWALWYVLVGLGAYGGANFAPSANAHEIRPGYLEIVETANEQYRINWKQPVSTPVPRSDGLGGNNSIVRGLGLRPIFPPNCRRLTDSRISYDSAALIETFDLACENGLRGQVIAVEGLQKTITDIFIRFVPRGAEPLTLRLTPRSPAKRLSGGGFGFMSYFGLGIEHLLFGYDHILFVLGLVLLVAAPLRIIWVITSFTLAHSLTLALSILNLVSLQSAPVEAGIALSILFVALELTRTPKERVSFGDKTPYLIAFSFGLLHGFGFADALYDIGLPSNNVGIALLMFNLGVEAGQICVVALVLAGMWLIPFKPLWRLYARHFTIYMMGGLAVYWLLVRLAVVLPWPGLRT